MCMPGCVCVLHAFCRGCSGEKKQLQGKLWGKRLLNPNLQVGMYINAQQPPPPFSSYKCGCLFVLTCTQIKNKKKTIVHFFNAASCKYMLETNLSFGYQRGMVSIVTFVSTCMSNSTVTLDECACTVSSHGDPWAEHAC